MWRWRVGGLSLKFVMYEFLPRRMRSGSGNGSAGVEITCGLAEAWFPSTIGD